MAVLLAVLLGLAPKFQVVQVYREVPHQLQVAALSLSFEVDLVQMNL